MKRILSALLVMMLIFSMVSCELLDTEYIETNTTPADTFVSQIETTEAPDEEVHTSTTVEIPETTAETSIDTTIEVTTEASEIATEVEMTAVTTTASAASIGAEDAVLPLDSYFNIRYIDVGQADAALVECDGHYMLIDGGNKSDSSKMYSILRSEEAKELDIVVGTHAHEDHIGGLAGALNYATSKLTLCPVTSHDSEAFEDFAKYANKNGGGITVPNVGDEYSLGSATVTILGVNGAEGVNNSSIILKITYGDTSFLFTGDAEREAEQAVLDSGADIASTVLKVGHHGSNTSTSYVFLRAVKPKYAVISLEEDNSYGHPREDTLSRLRDADVKVYRTDMQGDVYATSDGKNVTITVAKNADADTLQIPSVVVVPEVTTVATTVATTEATTIATTEATTAATTVATTVATTTTAAPIVPVAPSEPEYDYVLNTNTKKFHYPSCKSVKQMKEKNKGYFTGTRDEVIARGYDSCGNCHP